MLEVKRFIDGIRHQERRKRIDEIISLTQLSGEFRMINERRSCDALAYLWLAVDAGLNIIVTGNKPDRLSVLNSIIRLIPIGINTITVTRKGLLNSTDALTNSILFYGKECNKNLHSQINLALKFAPSRIILDDISGPEIFSNVPFIASMESDDEPARVIKNLAKVKVNYNQMGALDISVGMRNGCIESIHEYMWLNKAEALDGIEIGDNALSPRRIFEMGKPMPSRIPKSKTVYNFANKHAYSIERALNELESRTRLLNGTETAHLSEVKLAS